jgi:hypothetical protein
MKTCVYLQQWFAEFFLQEAMFRSKVVDKIKTRFMLNILF